jgi:hypothetical protein
MIFPILRYNNNAVRGYNEYTKQVRNIILVKVQCVLLTIRLDILFKIYYTNNIIGGYHIHIMRDDIRQIPDVTLFVQCISAH